MLGHTNTARHSSFPEEVHELLRQQYSTAISVGLEMTYHRYELGFRCCAHPWREITLWDRIAAACRRFANQFSAEGAETVERRKDVFFAVLFTANGSPPEGRTAIYDAYGSVSANQMKEITEWLFADERDQESRQLARRLRGLLQPDSDPEPDRIRLGDLLIRDNFEFDRFVAWDKLDEVDVVVAVGIESGSERVAYGLDALQCMVTTGVTEPRRILRVMIREDRDHLVRLAALLLDLKGRHDLQDAAGLAPVIPHVIADMDRLLDQQRELARSEFVASRPNASPHWRWDRACSVMKAGQELFRTEDEPTLRAVEFLKARVGAPEPMPSHPALKIALDLYEANEKSRWLLESNVLAQVPAERIAEKLSLLPDVVTLYEAIFFDVRASLDAKMWIVCHALGRNARNKDDQKDLGRIWRELAFSSGEPTLDLAVAWTTGDGREKYSEVELEQIELAIALDQLPPHGKDALQIHLRCRAEAAGLHPSSWHMPGVICPSGHSPTSSTASGVTADRSIHEACRTTVGPSSESEKRWEKRQRGGLYRYRAVRIDGKPRRIYLGTGPIGRIHELLDRREARVKQAAREARDREIVRLKEADQYVEAAREWSRSIAAAVLVTSGYFSQHGNWRKVKGRPRTRQRHADEIEVDEPTTLLGRLDAATKAANGGDPAAQANVRSLLAEPSDVWAEVASVNRQAIDCWRSLNGERHGLDREDLARTATVEAVQLVGTDPTLAEQAIAQAMEAFRLTITFATNTPETVGTAERNRLKRLRAAIRFRRATHYLLSRVQSIRFAIPNFNSGTGSIYHSTSEPAESRLIAG